MFDAGKTRVIVLSYGEKNYDDMLSRFYLIGLSERNGRTDRRADLSIPRVSMLTRNKNEPCLAALSRQNTKK